MKGTAPVAVQANRSKGTATVAVRYREDAAGTSGAAHPLVSSSRTKLKKNCASRTSRALTREFLTRNNNLKIKIAHKLNFVFSSPVHQGAVTSL